MTAVRRRDALQRIGKTRDADRPVVGDRSTDGTQLGWPELTRVQRWKMRRLIHRHVSDATAAAELVSMLGVHADEDAAVPIGHKRCVDCRTVKPFEDFPNVVSKAWHVHSRCRECAKNTPRREQHNA